jgi:hypothetical protein
LFNPKISGIIAGAAFVLSFLIGLFTGSQFLPVLLRAFVLAVIFFVLSALAYWLVSQFLPELLSPPLDDSGEIDVPGSKVDISIDASDDEDESNNTLQNSSMQGLDQKTQDDYNGEGERGISSVGDSAASAAVPDESSESGDVSKSVDVLPDLESMSGYFAPSEESDDGEDVVEMEDDLSSAPSLSEPSRSRKNSDPGDFNVQEMASAIQTILRREDKG